MSHHSAMRERAPGWWEPARPLRDSSWWHRRKQERACRRAAGHCWHPADPMTAWFCCMCSADEDGMPAMKCAYCMESP